MKHLTLFALLCVFLFGQADVSSLKETVEAIRSVNEKLIVYKATKLDANATNNVRYKKVEQKKRKLISSLPPLITKFRYLGEEDKVLQAKTEEISKKLERYKEKKDIIRTTNYYFKLAGLKADRIFYKTIDKLNELTNSFVSENVFKEPIEESLLSLQTLNLPDIPKELSTDKKTKLWANDIYNEKVSVRSKVETYIEILQYIERNSYLFLDIDIGYGISYINANIPFKLQNINFGKVILSLSVVLFFLMVAYLLKKRTFFIFILTPSRNTYSKEVKEAIIRSTNRPLYALILIYCIDTCCSIFYHPYAQPNWMKSVLNASYIISIAWIFIGVISGYGIGILSSLVRQDNNHIRKEVANLVLKIIYFIIFIIALILILSNFGINVSAIVASLGIGGLAVALAAKDILANFFASVMLLFDNSFSQGDWIKCKDIEGHVIEIGLRRTTVRTFDNSMLFVPNSTLANEPIQNWSRRRVGRRIKMSVGLMYNSPKDKLEKCVKDIRDMLLTHPDISQPDDMFRGSMNSKLYFKEHILSIDDLEGYKRTLFVHLDAFSPSSIDILIYCFSKTTNWGEWLQVKEDLMFKIIDIVEANGLGFAFPSQSIYVESLPKEELEHLLNKKENV